MCANDDIYYRNDEIIVNILSSHTRLIIKQNTLDPPLYNILWCKICPKIKQDPQNMETVMKNFPTDRALPQQINDSRINSKTIIINHHFNTTQNLIQIKITIRLTIKFRVLSLYITTIMLSMNKLKKKSQHKIKKTIINIFKIQQNNKQKQNNTIRSLLKSTTKSDRNKRRY
jgi:hypothetical protein